MHSFMVCSMKRYIFSTLGCIHPQFLNHVQIAQGFIWIQTSPTGMVFTVELEVASDGFSRIKGWHFLVYITELISNNVCFDLCWWHFNYQLKSTCCGSPVKKATAVWLCCQRLRLTQLFFGGWSSLCVWWVHVVPTKIYLQYS